MKKIIFLGVHAPTLPMIAFQGQTKGGTFSTPTKHRKGRPSKELDEFDICAIRQNVYYK